MSEKAPKGFDISGSVISEAELGLQRAQRGKDNDSLARLPGPLEGVAHVPRRDPTKVTLLSEELAGRVRQVHPISSGTQTPRECRESNPDNVKDGLPE